MVAVVEGRPGQRAPGVDVAIFRRVAQIRIVVLAQLKVDFRLGQVVPGRAGNRRRDEDLVVRKGLREGLTFLDDEGGLRGVEVLLDALERSEEPRAVLDDRAADRDIRLEHPGGDRRAAGVVVPVPRFGRVHGRRRPPKLPGGRLISR